MSRGIGINRERPQTQVQTQTQHTAQFTFNDQSITIQGDQASVEHFLQNYVQRDGEASMSWLEYSRLNEGRPEGLAETLCYRGLHSGTADALARALIRATHAKNTQQQELGEKIRGIYLTKGDFVEASKAIAGDILERVKSGKLPTSDAHALLTFAEHARIPGSKEGDRVYSAASAYAADPKSYGAQIYQVFDQAKIDLQKL